MVTWSAVLCYPKYSQQVLVFACFFIVDLLNSVLKGSDDGVLYLIKPRVWTFSIVTGL
jgi:hypothetical protein